MARVNFRQRDVAAAIKALKSEGLAIIGLRVNGSEFEVLTGPPSSTPMSAIERWRADQSAKRASQGR